MPPVLDHIVILIPYAQLVSLPSWIPKNFTLTPGGRHSDNKTENKLICFRDGSYFEFIAFINDDPKLRAGHKWGDCKFGIIDFALTHSDLSADDNWKAVNNRLIKTGCGVIYKPPLPGGRIRADGQEVKWTVTVPDIKHTNISKGALPFFCHDVTPRALRVPDSAERTTHPSAAYGLRSFAVFVPQDQVEMLAQAYGAILDTYFSADDFDDWYRCSQIKRLRIVEGSKNIGVLIANPREDADVEAFKEKGGALLGGTGFILRRLDQNKPYEDCVRIDVPGEDGMGGMYLQMEDK